MDQQLAEWKERRHKPVLLQGARQVGKTTTVREFSKSYDTYIELNMLEEPDQRTIFEGSLKPDFLKNRILLLQGLEKPEGKVLLLIDEIQKCPLAIQSLKFWCEDADWDVIAAGSELSVLFIEDTFSWPVGYIEYFSMNSLDFEEFLWAKNVPDEILNMLRGYAKERNPVPAAIHLKMQEYLKQYMAVGGMPEVVQTWIETNDWKRTDNVQKQVLSGYIRDIAHLAPPKIQLKSKSCYQSIAGQLIKQNHKFQYSLVEKKGTARKFSSALDWLLESRMVIKTCNLSCLEYPSCMFKDEDDFRIYTSDIGLTMAQFGFEMKAALAADTEIEAASTHPALQTAKGGLYEALAAEILWKMGREKIYFYQKKNSTSEIDFVIETMNGPAPVEIKAGRARSRSLDTVLKNQPALKGYKFGSSNIHVNGNKTILPLYLLPFMEF